MRILSRTIARTLLVTAVIAGCSGATAPDRELKAARALWQQRHPASYDITIARSCECTAEMGGPVIVSVRDGVVVSRTYVATGAAVGSSYTELFPTIDGLFARIDDARSRNAASLDVNYDSEFGFPALIAIDYDRVMVDDEISYRATDFQLR
jgi:hypothetical protein